MVTGGIFRWLSVVQSDARGGVYSKGLAVIIVCVKMEEYHFKPIVRCSDVISVDYP